MRRLTRIVLLWPLLATPAAYAQSFSLDDNPSAPVTSPAFPAVGYGAENPFGFGAGGFPPGLTPSPSLPLVPAADADILGPGPLLQISSPGPGYMDSLSANQKDNGKPIRLNFSVDRLSPGAAATAVSVQAGLSQQSADIYASTDLFTSPGAYAGLAGPLTYAGLVGGGVTAWLGGAASNTLAVDDSALGLLAGGVVVPPAVAAWPIGPAGPAGVATHDNLDGFDFTSVNPDGDFLFNTDTYFTVNPDEAAVAFPAASAADIFAVAAGAAFTPAIPYASAASMGLDGLGADPNFDCIDALIMFDSGQLPVREPDDPNLDAGILDLIEPNVDYALFSLAPGSVSLGRFGLSDSEVFFTNFTGSFWTYAFPAELGLVPGGMGAVRAWPPVPGQWDNIDALAVPEPGTIVMLACVGLLGLVACVWRRRNQCRAAGAVVPTRSLTRTSHGRCRDS